MKYLVVGYCDLLDKPRGLSSCVMFAPDDQFLTDTVPTTAEMLEYATALCVYPSSMKGAKPGQCQPVYFIQSS